MFQSTAQTKEQQASAAAVDYRAARKGYTEAIAERARVLAAPVATADVVNIFKQVLARQNRRFDEFLLDKIAALSDPNFDPTNPEQLDGLDPVRILGMNPWVTYAAATNTLMQDQILHRLEQLAKREGGDRGWTLEKKRRELAKLEATAAEYDSASQRALNLWRSATGRLREFPE